MADQKRNGRWVIDWQDRSRDPDRRILVSRDTVAEVRELIRDILSDQTWAGSAADATQSAYSAFIEEESGDDTDEKFLALWTGITFECAEGVLHVVRER
jgi:hypothetical protein